MGAGLARVQLDGGDAREGDAGRQPEAVGAHREARVLRGGGPLREDGLQWGRHVNGTMLERKAISK